MVYIRELAETSFSVECREILLIFLWLFQEHIFISAECYG